MRYEDLGSKLIVAIPELEDLYRKELEWWGEETPGPHVIYGDVLTPHIVRLLESGTDVDAIRRAFGLLETLIADSDIEVQAVAVVTVLDWLVGNPKWLRLMKPHVGPLAREAVRDLIAGSQEEQLNW